jgi:hypothetical protein
VRGKPQKKPQLHFLLEKLMGRILPKHKYDEFCLVYSINNPEQGPHYDFKAFLKLSRKELKALLPDEMPYFGMFAVQPGTFLPTELGRIEVRFIHYNWALQIYIPLILIVVLDPWMDSPIKMS